VTISPAVSAALRVINAAWAEGPSYDLASQAAFALDAAGRLETPEAAAEDRWNAAAVQRVRDLVAYWSGVEGGKQAAEAIESVVLGTHRPLPTMTEWAWDGGQPPTTEVEQLRAQVAELTALLKRAQDEARSAHGAEAASIPGAGERPKICGQSDEYGRRCDLREHATGDHGRLVGLGLDNLVTWPASPADSGETGGA